MAQRPTRKPGPRSGSGSREPTGKFGVQLFVLIAATAALVFATRSCGDSSNASRVPDDLTLRTAAEQLVKNKLRDPGSAEFSDVRVIAASSGGSNIVCGRVNARNGFGGMIGRQRFIVGSTTMLKRKRTKRP